MKKIMNFLMLSCKKAAALIDKKNITGLSKKEAIMLTMHTAACNACASYQKQSKIIDEVLQQFTNPADANEATIIKNDGLSNKIISSIG